MEHKKNWVASVAATHSYPLTNAANFYCVRFIDSILGDDLADFGKDRVRIRLRLRVCP